MKAVALGAAGEPLAVALAAATSSRAICLRATEEALPRNNQPDCAVSRPGPLWPRLCRVRTSRAGCMRISNSPTKPVVVADTAAAARASAKAWAASVCTSSAHGRLVGWRKEQDEGGVSTAYTHSLLDDACSGTLAGTVLTRTFSVADTGCASTSASAARTRTSRDSGPVETGRAAMAGRC